MHHVPHKHREAASGLTKEQTRQSLRNSMYDGTFASVTGGLTGNYITPYALTLQATTQQIGYLSSLPSFINMLVLFIAPTLSERVGSRKAFILPAVFAQAALYLPMLALPFIFHTNQVWWLITLVALSTAAGGIVGPPWSAMMADLIPMELRGSYFGVRNRINGFVSLIFSFITGGLLQVFTGDTRLAFGIVFAGAFVSRLISLYYLSLMLEPHPTMPKNLQWQSMWQISRSVFTTNIGRFILFTIFLNMAVNIGSPFFSVYVLRELKISYISYQIINAASAVMTMVIVTWWGKHADKAGNVKILRISSWMIPFVPVLWLVNSSVEWMSVVMLFSGFVWAGFNLCAGLFIYDAAPQENRTRYIALFGALGAIGSTVGSLIGGNLGPHLIKINGSFYLSLFLLSGLMRLIVVIVFFRKIEEVRDIVPVKALEMLFGGLRPRNLANWWQTTYHRARRQRRQR